ncbi:protein disulfide oxidoreductase domain protein [Colletotrichum incanum]|nr:protein disulfide oxidoreductase domain protein [Colletotrichum incanum]
MAVPPKFAAHKLTFGPPKSLADGNPAGGVPSQPHTLELYLDYVCPYSAKQFNTFYNAVVPAIRANPAWASNVEVIFRQQVQPWHPSSTLVHESAVAVIKVAPHKFWEYSDALFKAQKDYFDANVVNEPRNDTYRRLAKLAGSVGVDEDKVLQLLLVSDKPDSEGALNVGNGVTNDFKVLIKLARLTGVHVSPTVLFDGYPNNEISSGWTLDQWKEWLQKNIV